MDDKTRSDLIKLAKWVLLFFAVIFVFKICFAFWLLSKMPTMESIMNSAKELERYEKSIDD